MKWNSYTETSNGKRETVKLVYDKFVIVYSSVPIKVTERNRKVCTE